MRYTNRLLFAVFLCLFLFIPNKLYAQLDDTQVINRELVKRIDNLRAKNGFSSEDFNACQITWTTRALEKTEPQSQFIPHEITFLYEDNEIIKLINYRGGDIESIQGLGLNCLEFNSYVYLFIDTLGYDTRYKFGLDDLSYVIYSSDKGATWSKLQSLHQFSIKAKFVLPHDKFLNYVKIFGNRNNHALSIFNVRDETTYLFSPTFEVLKSVPVYNRLTNYTYPNDFYYHKNILYLYRGGCEMVRERIQCPLRTYLETSRNFGQTWSKETLPFIKKSFLLTINNVLYHFYYKSCPSNWFSVMPGWNRSLVCGHIKVRTLNILGHWDKPKTLIKTADQLLDVIYDEEPILVWSDFRFHKSRTCGYIPVVGCADSNPFIGPQVTYAGTLNLTNWEIDESITEYKN